MQKDNINPFHIKAHALRSTAYLQCKTEKYCFSTRLTNYLTLVMLYLSYYLQNNLCLLSCKIPGSWGNLNHSII